MLSPPPPSGEATNLSKAIPSLLSLHHDTLLSCFYFSCWVGFNVNCDVLLYGTEIRLPDEEHGPISFKIQLYHWSPFLFNLSKSRKLWQDFSSFPGWLNCPTFPWNTASPLTAGRAVEDAFGSLWEGWGFIVKWNGSNTKEVPKVAALYDAPWCLARKAREHYLNNWTQETRIFPLPYTAWKENAPRESNKPFTAFLVQGDRPLIRWNQDKVCLGLSHKWQQCLLHYSNTSLSNKGKRNYTRTQNNLNYHGLAYFLLSLQDSPECVLLP